MYLLVNLETGGLDGFYFDKQTAHRIANTKNQAGEKWLITRVLNTKHLPFEAHVPEHLWWMNKQELQEA